MNSERIGALRLSRVGAELGFAGRVLSTWSIISGWKDVQLQQGG